MKPDPAWTPRPTQTQGTRRGRVCIGGEYGKGHDEALRAWAEAKGRLIYIGRAMPWLGL
jgi:hypothetical protein